MFSSGTDISDHHVVVTTITNFLDIKFNKRKMPAKICFNFDKMNDDLWNKFSLKFDALLNGSLTKTINQDTYWTQPLLNKHWDLFQNLLIKAAEKCIPLRKSSGQFKYPRPPGLTKLYSHQKTLHKFKKLLLNVKQGGSFPVNWMKLYDDF